MWGKKHSEEFRIEGGVGDRGFLVSLRIVERAMDFEYLAKKRVCK